jgi:hypothetical protein
VPTTGQGGDDVVGDLSGPEIVRDQVAVDGGDAAGCGGIGVAGVAVTGGVDLQDRLGCWGVG